MIPAGWIEFHDEMRGIVGSLTTRFYSIHPHSPTWSMMHPEQVQDETNRQGFNRLISWRHSTVDKEKSLR
jgi:hypothetical protein